MIPGVWEFVLLALAAFRFWKLLADDRILDRPRDWLLAKFPTDERETYWSDFLVCPWCAGFWITLLTYLGWIVLGPGTWDGEWFLGGVALFALSGTVGLIATALDLMTSGTDKLDK